ncbi:hypothetical protein ASE75_02395 [Sphingomonas sp. Leaf17]|uniref:hypothetical protein n=1 Tax=Sphingomonas sp. Leaf17 TaxID=1735683 RepID=UPI0006FD0784|nr:hypothetical protein [Sphingomonas sp. Leaf17]KQM67775.1 hypothetical protein ASE75_02395 [Sphingomonas sp. Leaf17]
MPFAKLFRSRWAALLWAGGILWTAVDVADSNGTSDVTTNRVDATGEPVNDVDLSVLASAIKD